MKAFILLVVLTANVVVCSPVQGRRYRSKHELRANQEVRTIVSAIVDAILDGDRERRSEVVDPEDTEDSDSSKSLHPNKKEVTGDPTKKLDIEKREETDDPEDNVQFADTIATSDVKTTEGQLTSLKNILKRDSIVRVPQSKENNKNRGSKVSLNGNPTGSSAASITTESSPRLPDSIAKMVDKEELASLTGSHNPNSKPITRSSKNDTQAEGDPSEDNGMDSSDNNEDDYDNGMVSVDETDADSESEPATGDEMSDKPLLGDEDGGSAVDGRAPENAKNPQNIMSGEFDTNSKKKSEKSRQFPGLGNLNSKKTSKLSSDIMSAVNSKEKSDINKDIKNKASNIDNYENNQQKIIDQENSPVDVSRKKSNKSDSGFSWTEYYLQPVDVTQAYISMNSSGVKKTDINKSESFGDNSMPQSASLSNEGEEKKILERGLKEVTGKRWNITSDLVSKNSEENLKNNVERNDKNLELSDKKSNVNENISRVADKNQELKDKSWSSSNKQSVSDVGSSRFKEEKSKINKNSNVSKNKILKSSKKKKFKLSKEVTKLNKNKSNLENSNSEKNVADVEKVRKDDDVSETKSTNSKSIAKDYMLKTQDKDSDLDEKSSEEKDKNSKSTNKDLKENILGPNDKHKRKGTENKNKNREISQYLPESDTIESVNNGLDKGELPDVKTKANELLQTKYWNDPENGVITLNQNSERFNDNDEHASDEDLGEEPNKNSERDPYVSQASPQTLFIGGNQVPGKATNPGNQPENFGPQYDKLGNGGASDDFVGINSFGRNGYTANGEQVTGNDYYKEHDGSYVPTDDVTYAQSPENRLGNLNQYEYRGSPAGIGSVELAKRSYIPAARRDDIYRLRPQLGIQTRNDISRQQPELKVPVQYNTQTFASLSNEVTDKIAANNGNGWQKKSDIGTSLPEPTEGDSLGSLWGNVDQNTGNNGNRLQKGSDTGTSISEPTEGDPLGSLLGDVGAPWISNFLSKTLKMAVNGDPAIKAPASSGLNVGDNNSVEQVSDPGIHDLMPTDATKISDDQDYNGSTSKKIEDAGNDQDNNDEDVDNGDNKGNHDNDDNHVKENNHKNDNEDSDEYDDDDDDDDNDDDKDSTVYETEKPVTQEGKILDTTDDTVEEKTPLKSVPKLGGIPLSEAVKNAGKIIEKAPPPPDAKIMVLPGVTMIANKTPAVKPVLDKAVPVNLPAPPKPIAAPLPAVKLPAPPFPSTATLPAPVKMPIPAPLPAPVKTPSPPVPFIAPLPAPVRTPAEKLPEPPKAQSAIPFNAQFSAQVMSPFSAPVKTPLSLPVPAPVLAQTPLNNGAATQPNSQYPEQRQAPLNEDITTTVSYIDGENSIDQEEGILTELNNVMKDRIQEIGTNEKEMESKETKLRREIKEAIPVESQRPADIDNDIKQEVGDLKDYASALSEAVELSPTRHDDVVKELASGLMDEVRVANSKKEELLKELISYVTSIEVETMRERLSEVRVKLWNYATNVSDDPKTIRGEAIRLLDEFLDLLPLPAIERSQKQNEILQSKLFDSLVKEGNRRALRGKLKKALLDLMADKLI